nr:MAG TPA: hypothetical protein [Caudoviricetes sp.]
MNVSFTSTRDDDFDHAIVLFKSFITILFIVIALGIRIDHINLLAINELLTVGGVILDILGVDVAIRPVAILQLNIKTDTLCAIEHIKTLSAGRTVTIFEENSKLIAGFVHIDDIQILDSLCEWSAQIQFKGDRSQTVVVQIDLARKIDHSWDLIVILLFELILEIGFDLVSARVIEAEVIVEAAGTVDQIIIQAIELVTGDNEQLFACAGTIEQTQHRILRIVIAGSFEGLVKLIKQNHNLLVDCLNKIGNARNVLRDKDYRIALFDRFLRNHLSGQRFTDAFVAAEDNTQVTVEHLKRIQYLGNLAALNAINLFTDRHARTTSQIKTGHLSKADIIRARWNLIISLHIIAIQMQAARTFNDFHIDILPLQSDQFCEFSFQLGHIHALKLRILLLGHDSQNLITLFLFLSGGLAVLGFSQLNRHDILHQLDFVSQFRIGRAFCRQQRVFIGSLLLTVQHLEDGIQILNPQTPQILYGHNALVVKAIAITGCDFKQILFHDNFSFQIYRSDSQTHSCSTKLFGISICSVQ